MRRRPRCPTTRTTGVYGEGTIYSGMGGRSSVLAAHLRLGFVRPFSGLTGEAVLHPRKRFYAGGSQSVRGYGENQLGPRILTLPHGYLINAQTASRRAVRRVVRRDPVLRPEHGARLHRHGAAADRRRQVHAAAARRNVAAGGERGVPVPAAFLKNLGGAVFVDGAAVGERVFDPLGGGHRDARRIW